MRTNPPAIIGIIDESIPFSPSIKLFARDALVSFNMKRRAGNRRDGPGITHDSRPSFSMWLRLFLTSSREQLISGFPPHRAYLLMSQTLSFNQCECYCLNYWADLRAV